MAQTRTRNGNASAPLGIEAQLWAAEHMHRKATQTVLEQAEALSEMWAVAS